MKLRIERLDANNYKIQGEIKIEFSMFEKAFQLIESLIRELSEHKSSMRKIANKTSQELKLTPKRFLSVQETAEYLGVSPRTIYNKLSCAGESPFSVKPKRYGKKIRFDIRDLDQYLDSL